MRTRSEDNPFGREHFADRDAAGRVLANRLKRFPFTHPLILAIPRGGVVTGAVIAKELGAELDVVLVHKLSAPGRPDLAIGAVAEDGEMFLNPGAFRIEGVDNEYIRQEREFRLHQLEQRHRIYRASRQMVSRTDRSIILTDDGVATGATMIAAIELLRQQGTSSLFIAVPVAPRNRWERLMEYTPGICLILPEVFVAVAQVYRSFEQVDDAQVVKLLKEFAPSTAEEVLL